MKSKTDTILEQRAVSFHQTAMAVGTKAELAIITAAMDGSERQLLRDDNDVFLPVGNMLGMLTTIRTTAHPIAQMAGFDGLLEFLEVLKRKNVSWVVLDTKRDKS